MKKVIIIGAGIAGLTAGIYAQLSGFKSEIYEQHTIAGGYCTSWRRKGFLFEGGMHWLTGSKSGSALNELWRETGALGDNNPVHLRDPFLTYIDSDGGTTCLYRDLEKLRGHLTDISPEDKDAIDRMCADVKKFENFGMPITDIRGLKTKNKAAPFGIGSMIKMMPLLPAMGALNKYSVTEYLERFKSRKIRNLLSGVIPAEFSAFSLVMTLVTLTTGDGGYSEGGALRMAENMAKKYGEAGGVIHYSSPVEKIITENNKAAGITVNGEIIPADAVIVTADTRTAIDRLFEKPLDEKWAADMRQHTKPQTCVFLCFGIGADLSDMPETFLFELEQPVEFADGSAATLFGLNNYSAYKGYAPQGKTAATAFINGDRYNYWKAAKDDGTYAQKKQQVAEQAIALYEQRFPELKGKFEVWDVVTPITYERYCSGYRGSWMSVMAAGDRQRTYPAKSESISGLYFAGQRLMMPGGMPVAVMTGRQAAQHLCKDNDAVFCNTAD